MKILRIALIAMTLPAMKVGLAHSLTTTQTLGGPDPFTEGLSPEGLLNSAKAGAINTPSVEGVGADLPGAGTSSRCFKDGKGRVILCVGERFMDRDGHIGVVLDVSDHGTARVRFDRHETYGGDYRDVRKLSRWTQCVGDLCVGDRVRHTAYYGDHSLESGTVVELFENGRARVRFDVVTIIYCCPENVPVKKLSRLGTPARPRSR